MNREVQAGPYGKPCTCDNCLGSSCACRVEAGETLGRLWYCRNRAEAVARNPHCLNDGKPCNPDGTGGCVSCNKYATPTAQPEAVVPCDGCGMSANRRCPECHTTACADCVCCDHDSLPAPQQEQAALSCYADDDEYPRYPPIKTGRAPQPPCQDCERLRAQLVALQVIADRQRADERYYSDYTDSMRVSDLNELHRAIAAALNASPPKEAK